MVVFQSNVSALCTPGVALGIDQYSLPIFNQDWWIEIARGSSDYRELTVSHGNVVVGSLPVVLSRNRVGLVRAHSPHWSSLGGPILDESLPRAEQTGVLNRLLEQLPQASDSVFVCNPCASYADLVRDAFHAKGFVHSTQATYVHRPGDGDVMETRKRKHRGHIKRAARDLDCEEIGGEDFVRFFDANLKAWGKKSYGPLEVLTRLIDAAVSRRQARALAARPNRGNRNGHGGPPLYDGAIVYVWDRERCYYWRSTRRIASRNSSDPRPHPDAIKFLAMKAMQDAREMNLIFDSDGIVTLGSQNLYHNMFGLRNEQGRDVFERETTLARVYQKYRTRFKSMLAGQASLKL